MKNYLIDKIDKPLLGEVKIASDKSISHRALIFSSLANGKNVITNLLESEDVLNTAKALQQLGANITKKSESIYEVIGVGISGLTESDNIIDCGNSGTGVRLLMGLVTPFNFKTLFTGDSSLRSRPMNRIFKPMQEIGAQISSRDAGLLPATIIGTNEALPINYEMPKASAQIKSSILLAALNIVGKTTIIEPDLCRDHTEIMMQYLGLDLEIEELATGGRKISYQGMQEFQSKDISVPDDISSAAFFIVAALIIPGSEIKLTNIGLNPLRDGIIETLLEMGGNIKIINKQQICGEWVADLEISYSQLKGVTVKANRVARMIDEYPILSIAAAHAEGVTKMENLSELKVKESNRLSAIYENIIKCGIQATMGEDSLEITGGIKNLDHKPQITTFDDHRIAMSFFILGLTLENGLEIDDMSMIATSFPNFIDIFKQNSK